MARASCSAGCAPDTAYFCANTKVGTPEIPLSEASLACAEISSTSSSVARRLRTSSASSPQSAAACSSTLVSGRSPPSRKYNSISRRDDAPGDALVSLRRAEFRGEVFVTADPFARHPVVEKERPPVNLDRHIARQRQRVLDPALADVAPRAHHVGD